MKWYKKFPSNIHVLHKKIKVVSNVLFLQFKTSICENCMSSKTRFPKANVTFMIILFSLIGNQNNFLKIKLFRVISLFWNDKNKILMTLPSKVIYRVNITKNQLIPFSSFPYSFIYICSKVSTRQFRKRKKKKTL